MRQNAIAGLRAIGTQEALEFLNSKKDDLSKNIRILMDGGELKKGVDGRIMIGRNPTIMTWFGIIFWGVLALGILAIMIRAFLEGSGFDLRLLVPVCLFGYLAFDAYQRTQRGQITIDPTTHKLKSRKREINFDDIETIVTKRVAIPLRGAGTKVTFQALVTNGEPLILGSVSGIDGEKKAMQIINLLVEQGLSFKH